MSLADARLEAAWTDALTSSLSYFRALLSSSPSSSWKPVSVLPLTESSTARDGGKSHAGSSSALGRITANEVVIHRRPGKNGEVYRAVVEVDCGADVSVDTFRGCLVTPETRSNCESLAFTSSGFELRDRGPHGGGSGDARLAGRTHPRDQD
jgi:hypothetical protein